MILWIILVFVLNPRLVCCLTAKPSISAETAASAAADTSPILTEEYSVPLTSSTVAEARARSKETRTALETLTDLWNDPRPVSALLREGTSTAGSAVGDDVAYLVESEVFEAVGGCRFLIRMYPRGRFVVAGSGGGLLDGTAASSAYLRYLPSERGEEIDVAWTLRLVNNRTGEALPVSTSGGLPRSSDAFSAAMTLCSESEAVEGVGRASDRGSSTWRAGDVCDALRRGELRAEGSISLFGRRTEELSLKLSWPPRGAVGAVWRAASNAAAGHHCDGESEWRERTFRAGEVLVPISRNSDDVETTEMLEKAGIFSGFDYRIMTMSDKQGNAIFSTADLPTSGDDRRRAKLALRPTSWKLQKRMWDERGFTEWPVEIEAGLLSSSSLTRFNLGAALPRLSATVAQDAVAFGLAVAIALLPVPVAVAGREVASFYAIPSASMSPTLEKGDVLLVEKLPGVFERTRRGDVVLFNPPPALERIIHGQDGGKGKGILGGKSLFVKRVVGMPGDEGIVMDDGTREVTVGGLTAVGPDRNLCDDEPLRLIDHLLETGKGKDIPLLGEEDVYVLGDCKSVSVDSRVFGPLPKKNIVGKPIARIWPLHRIVVGSL